MRKSVQTRWLVLTKNAFTNVGSLGTSFGPAPISDVSALKGLRNLRYLWLNGTQVTDMSPLNGLTNLRRLIPSESATDTEVRRLQKSLPQCQILR